MVHDIGLRQAETFPGGDDRVRDFPPLPVRDPDDGDAADRLQFRDYLLHLGPHETALLVSSTRPLA